MSTPVFSKTLGGMVVELATMMGDNIIDGTADSGSTSTIVEDILVDADDSVLLGAWVYVYGGTAAGDKRRITTFTAGSDRITVTPNFSGTIDTSSTYVVTRQYSPFEYERAIKTAQRLIGSTGNLKQANLRSIITGNPYQNGNFDQWAAGTSAAPDGWTAFGSSVTIAREATQVRIGDFSVKVTTASAESGISQGATRIGRFRGQRLSLRGWVWNNTAGEAAIRLTDGVTTKTEDNSGSSNWEYLETDPFTMSDAATELTASFRVDTGTKVGYCSALWLPATVEHEYELETGINFVIIDGIAHLSDPMPTADGIGADDFSHTLLPETWEVLSKTSASFDRKVRLNVDGIGQRVLSINGWNSHNELTTAATSWTGNPEALLWRAKQILHQGRGDLQDAQFARTIADENEERFSHSLRGLVTAPKVWEVN